jgi:alkanesulfonate monooxygenase SsuD/methylene tetrahydromethanopterin reductase-like flavin-dependent oxidoreductase (luciferase family)
MPVKLKQFARGCSCDIHAHLLEYALRGMHSTPDLNVLPTRGHISPNRTRGASAGSGNGLLGSPEQILETIQRHRAAGADSFHLAFPAATRYDDMRRFAEEVLPQARTV